MIVLLSCVDHPTGPGNYDSATVDLQLTLPEGTPGIWFPRGDTLHVMVRRAGRPVPISEARIVVGDALRAVLEVPIASSVERFVATAEVRVGGQIFFLAFDAIQLRAGLDTTIEMLAAYVGPAAAVASFTIAPRDSTLRRSDTTSFVVAALDSLGQAISTVPLRFASARPAIVAVTDSGIAAAAPDAAMDTVRVVAWTPTGLTNSALFRIVRGAGGVPVTTEVIAFISTRDGSRELYMMNGDGTGAQRLTETVDDEFLPAWSPDRTEIAFDRAMSGNRQIVVLDIASGEERQLTTAGSNTGPRWKPDGSAIAFTSTAGGGSEIRIMSPDGSSQRRLVDPAGGADRFGDWAPDGSAFVFVRQASGFTNPALYRANADGSGIVEYPFDGPLPAHVARWSPLGGELVVERTTGSGTDVFLHPASPNAGTSLQTRLPRRTSDDRHYSFAATAHQFVFESGAEGSDGIYRGDTTGATSRLSPVGVEDLEPDHALPASPIYVSAVAVSPAQAALTSDESTQRFTAAVTDAGGRTVTVPLTWSNGVDGRFIPTQQEHHLDIIAVAVGPTQVIATYLDWRADTAEVAITPATGPIARRILLNVGFELFTMRGDGTDTVRVTPPDGEANYDPAWSPDALRIALRARVGGQDEIFVMNADGSGRVRLTTDAATDGRPSWSPDGRRIVFHSAPGGTAGSALWIVDADGGNRTQLTSGGNDVDPAWSPDGSLIAFARMSPGASTLHTVSPLGGPARPVQTGAGSVRTPAWSPDGTMLFYALSPAGGLSRIARVPFPAGAEVQLTSGRGPSTSGIGGDFEPSIAEDGMITFWSFRHPGLGGQQMVMRPDGSAQSGLLPVTLVSSGGAWRPDAPPLYAAAVTIGGDLFTPLVVDATRLLTGAAADQHGSPIAPIGGFRWMSLDPAVASVDSLGIVTAEATGNARIVAATGIAAPDTVALVVVPVGPGAPTTRTWAGGAVAGATDWLVAANWAPTGVPAAQDTVIIAAAPSQPVLTANAAIAALHVNGTGASLTLNGHTMWVTGDVTTGDGAAGASGGELVMQHPADTLRVGSDVVFSGASSTGRITAGTLIVAGGFEQRLTAENQTPFAPSGTHRTVLVGDRDQTIRFATPDSDRTPLSFFHHLEIAKGGGHVRFETSARINGVLRVSSASRLIDTLGNTFTIVDSLITVPGSELVFEYSELRLGGTMAVAGGYLVEETRLFGIGQVLQPGLPYNRVIINGTARLTGETRTFGNLEVREGPAGSAELRVGGHTLTIEGDLRIGAEGGALVMQHPADTVRVLADAAFRGGPSHGLLTAGALIVGRNFEQEMGSGSGASFAPSGTHLTVLKRQADHDVPQIRFSNGLEGSTESFFNHLEIASDTIELRSRVTVAGTLRTNPAFRPVVRRSGASASLVAAGVDLSRLRLNNVPLEIGPGPLTRFDSVSVGHANFDAPQLTVRHAGAAAPFTFTGLSFNDDAQAGTFVRAIDVTPGDGVVLVINLTNPYPAAGSPHTITEGGAIVNWGSTASGVSLTWVGGASSAPTSWFEAANWSPAKVPTPADTIVIRPTASQPVLTANVAVAELVVSGTGASLTLNGHSLVTTGDVQTSTTGGVIVMQQPADTLRVGGDATFGGGATTGLMTAGAILVDGDFTVLTEVDAAAFAPSGTHRTVLVGSATQAIRFSTASGEIAEASFFRHLEVAKPGGDVLWASGFAVTGVLRVSSASQIAGTVDLLWTVADSLVTVGGSTLVLEGDLSLGGVMAVGGSYAVGTTILTGQDQVLQPGLGYEDVVIEGTARLAGRTAVADRLDIAPRQAGETAELRVAGHTLAIEGALDVGPGGGVLVMQHATDSVIVAGRARFRGSSSTGWLTAGVLVVGGNFEQRMASGSGASFAPSGTHRTVLRRGDGDAPAVSFENGIAGATESFFNDLELASDTTLLRTRVTVAGTLRADPGPRRVLMGSTAPLVANAVDLSRLLLHDVPLEVGPGALSRLDSISFGRANYEAPQLTVRHPGAASAFTFTGLSFNDDAQSSTFIHAIDVAPGNGATLVIDVVDAGPTDGSAHTVTEGGAIVNWRSTAPGGVLTWVGAGFGPSWFEEANWSPARRPTLNDTIVIAPAARQPELNGPATVAKLTIRGAATSLRLNGNRLIVRGDFATGPNGGTVVMQDPSDTLQIEGATVFAGDPTIGLLTDGVLRLGGDLRQQYIGGNWAGFAPSGAHRTVLFGSQQQTVRFDSPAGAPSQRSFFNHLIVEKTAEAVWFATDAVINGVLSVRSPTLVRDLETRVTVHDSLTTVTGSELRFEGALRLGGGMNVAGEYHATTTGFFGSDQVIQPGLAYTNVQVDGRARFVGRTNLSGALRVGWLNPAGTIIGGDVALNGHTVIVAHSFETVPNGGTLTMTSSADTLRVLGGATFAGAPTIGTLTDGVLFIGGDFRQTYIGGNWAGFAPSGTHRTVLAGTQPQLVHFDSPDGAPTQRSRFHHLSIENLTTVSLATRAYANGDFALTSSGTLDGPATLVIAGALSTEIGSTLRPARVDVAGSVAIAGTFAADTIEYWGASQVVQAGLPYRQLFVGGTASLSGATTAAGVVVRSNTFGQQNDLDLAGQQLTVEGDFRTGPNGGSLTMMTAADLLTIGGNATFSGDVTLGRLTAGEMRLAGNFRQQYVGSNWAAFSPSGSHRVVLTGSTQQTLIFDSPDGAPTQRSHFHDLVLAGTGVSLGSRAYIRGVLSATAPFAPIVAGNGNALIADGVDVARLTLDNAPFTLGSGSVTRFDSVTFQGFSPTVNQLTVSHPGAAAAFTFVGLRFLVVPTTGWYVSATDIAPTDGATLRVQISGAQPSDGSARTQTAGGAVVTWIGGSSSGAFSAAGSMTTGRFSHAAVRLNDGRVLVAGGDGSSASMRSAELFAPATSAFTATGLLGLGRYDFAMVTLDDGRVLAVGGNDGTRPTRSTVIYDPATGSFPAGDTLGNNPGCRGRWWPTATRLPDGRVLIAGGRGSVPPNLVNGCFATVAEIFDPATNAFSAGGTMVRGRFRHSATTLADGRVLIAGGDDASSFIIAHAEIYDPTSGTFSATGAMTVARRLHSATRLPDGRILVAGGDANGSPTRATAEIYDPATGTFVVTGSMSIGRSRHVAFLLPDGRVLVAGGHGPGGPALASAEIYDPATGAFTAAAPMAVARYFAAGVPLADGRFLIVGGTNEFNAALNSAEVYQP